MLLLKVISTVYDLKCFSYLFHCYSRHFNLRTVRHETCGPKYWSSSLFMYTCHKMCENHQKVCLNSNENQCLYMHWAVFNWVSPNQNQKNHSSQSQRTQGNPINPIIQWANQSAKLLITCIHVARTKHRKMCANTNVC